MYPSKPKTPLSAQILEEASTWLVEFSEGDVGMSGRQEFDAWLRRSPEHIQAYLQIAALWEHTPLLQKGRTAAADELLARVLAESNVLELGSPEQAQLPATPVQRSQGQPHRRSPVEPAQSSASTRGRMRYWAVAAMFVIAIVGAVLGYDHFRAGTYATQIGEQRTIRLADGSSVEINSRSRLRVRFSEHERVVELLQGQAVFTVAKDPMRPFVVDADGTRVRAVGTRFDVYRRSSGTVVTVLEGRVAVDSSFVASRRPDAGASNAAPQSLGQRSVQTFRERTPSPSQRPNAEEAVVGAEREADRARESAARLDLSSSEILLNAGQRLIVTAVASAAPEPADIEAATAWTRGEIVFQGSSLSEVIEEFNRYNTRKLVIADPSLQHTRISGVFSSTDPESLLRFLRKLPDFRVHEADDEVRISRM